MERGGQVGGSGRGGNSRSSSPTKRLLAPQATASTQPCGLAVLLPCFLFTLIGVSYWGGSNSYIRTENASLAAMDVNSGC